MSSNPTKKVAIVTGSATGVGAATARLLAGSGWNVVINYSRSEQEARQTQASCAQLGVDTILCRADVSQDAECRQMVQQTVDRWGRIDGLVNNAGRTKYCAYADLDGLTTEDFLSLYQVNVVSAFLMSRAAMPYLQSSGAGAIVNTSSISAITGIGSSMAYAASKGALTTLTLSFAQTFGPSVRVNAVCPGFIQGRWIKNGLGPERYQQVKEAVESRTPLQNTCTPEDVAQAIVFLLCEAQMMTGEALVLDGGYYLNQVPPRLES